MRNRAGAGDDHGFFRDHERAAVGGCIDLLAHEIVDGGRAIQDYAAAEHRAALHDNAFVHAAISPNHHIVFNNHWHGADGLEDAADLRACGDVAIAPDLRATSDQSVRVDHRAIIDVRPGIDEHRRHARDAAPDVRAIANAAPAWNDAHLACEANRFDRIGVFVENRLSHAVNRHIDHLAHTKSAEEAFFHPRICAPPRFRCSAGIGRAHPPAIPRRLEATEITPRPPSAKSGNVMASSPERTTKCSGTRAAMEAICEMFPEASLTPTIVSIADSRFTVAGSIFTPVRPGTL